MCFIIKNLEEKIADKNITCYKAVVKTSDSPYKTPFAKTEIELNKQYDEKSNEFEIHLCTAIYKGVFHSFKTLDNALRFKGKTNDPNLDAFIVECVIPEGTKYMENDTQYVSKSIIYKTVLQKLDKKLATYEEGLYLINN